MLSASQASPEERRCPAWDSVSAFRSNGEGCRGRTPPFPCSMLPSTRRNQPCRRSEERRVGKEWRSDRDWSSDVCSSDLESSRSSCKNLELRPSKRCYQRVKLPQKSGVALPGIVCQLFAVMGKVVEEGLHPFLVQCFPVRAVTSLVEDRKSVV